ncbi:MAG: hypothetical protein LR015_05305 [Verrucomicrobia bacterium]|nr:hypothetical protein [Verrucomicrobiota bacterium]
MNFDQSDAVFVSRVFEDITALGFIIDRDTFETAVSQLAFRHFYVENGPDQEGANGVTTPYSEWLQAHGMQDLTGADKYHADLTGDGVPNLLKYAFGLHPASAEGQLGLPELWVEDHDGQAYLFLTYRRLKGGLTVDAHEYLARDLVYLVEVSDDLQNWVRSDSQGNPLVIQTAVEQLNPYHEEAESVTVRFLDPVNAYNGKLFMRLRVQINATQSPQ